MGCFWSYSFVIRLLDITTAMAITTKNIVQLCISQIPEAGQLYFTGMKHMALRKCLRKLMLF